VLLLHVVPEELVLIIPVAQHPLRVLAELLDTPVHPILEVHDEHVRGGVCDHEYSDQLEKQLVTVDQALLLGQRGHRREVIAAQQRLVEED
jgi:hypothetical protein